MRAVHLFLVTVVEARSARSVHEQGPNGPSRVHRSPGVLAISPSRVRAQELSNSFAENTMTVEHQPGGVR